MMSSSIEIEESQINIISTGTELEGKITFDETTRVYGRLKGEIHATPGSTLVLGETSIVEGAIFADTVMIDGYVKGDIFARTKVFVSGIGRVVGKIETPSLLLDFGAYFEGSCSMEKKINSKA
jgi:cytoskeletal protein CcmA (bactofilin family)